jgi:hypothetical protein
MVVGAWVEQLVSDEQVREAGNRALAAKVALAVVLVFTAINVVRAVRARRGGVASTPRSRLIWLAGFGVLLLASAGLAYWSTPRKDTSWSPEGIDPLPPEVAAQKPPVAPRTLPRPDARADLTGYFPLVPGTKYTYRADPDRTKTITVVGLESPAGPVFYFMETATETGSSPTNMAHMELNMFGEDAYQLRPSGLFTAPGPDDAIVLQQVSSGAFEFDQILPLPPRIGARGHSRGKYPQTYIIEAFEAVEVPAGKFKDALRVAIEGGAEHAKSRSTIWLARDVGLVRWEHSAGAVHELVSVTQGDAIPQYVFDQMAARGY